MHTKFQNKILFKKYTAKFKILINSLDEFKKVMKFRKINFIYFKTVPTDTLW